jgi:hypothetical protein
MSEFHGAQQSADLYKSRDQNDFELTESEATEVQERLKALKKFFGEKISARYKIEVQFGRARSTWKPFHGAMSLYLSGTKLDGGGDEKLYLCPREGCDGIILPIERFVEETKRGQAIARVPCPACGIMWAENELVGELFFNLTSRNWAHAVLKMFARLDHNADIYLKYHRTDIRNQAALEMARGSGGETLAKARKNRGLHIYPLKNIIKDTGAGAQLYDRFLAFINA